MLLSFWAFFYKKFYLLFLAPFLLIFVILIYPLITTGHFYDFSIELKSFLYQTSSKRLETWELVFSNLPSNIYFGSGIGNTMAFLPENTLNDAFHNAFLEILYETGILGLFLFLSFIFVGFRNYFKVLGSNDSVDRHLYLIFQSSMMALMVAGFFEKGYMSMYFKFDFYYFVLMVYILGKQIVKSESSICKPC